MVFLFRRQHDRFIQNQNLLRQDDTRRRHVVDHQEKAQQSRWRDAQTKKEERRAAIPPYIYVGPAAATGN